jgi:hypothetical protein
VLLRDVAALVDGLEDARIGGWYNGETAVILDVQRQPGANVIDVLATARGREPAMTALRVVRELPVEVPDLEDAEIAEAQERVADAGLQLEVHESGGLFDDLFGGELAVCEQDPEAGELVRRGTTIVVAVARSC